MSWDILIQNFPQGAVTPEDIPEDFQPHTLGSRDDVIQRISTIIPEVDFADPSWGILETTEAVIEFNIGDEEDCDSIMLHVRGGNDAVTTITRLLDGLGMRALDMQTGDFFDPQSARESFDEWQGHRDELMASMTTVKPQKKWWEFWK
jgi:hypothetical protein